MPPVVPLISFCSPWEGEGEELVGWVCWVWGGWGYLSSPPP